MYVLSVCSAKSLRHEYAQRLINDFSAGVSEQPLCALVEENDSLFRINRRHSICDNLNEAVHIDKSQQRSHMKEYSGAITRTGMMYIT